MPTSDHNAPAGAAGQSSPSLGGGDAGQRSASRFELPSFLTRRGTPPTTPVPPVPAPADVPAWLERGLQRPVAPAPRCAECGKPAIEIFRGRALCAADIAIARVHAAVSSWRNRFHAFDVGTHPNEQATHDTRRHARADGARRSVDRIHERSIATSAARRETEPSR